MAAWAAVGNTTKSPAEGGGTVTVSTVMVLVSARVSAVAMTREVPAATPVTRPVAETVATAGVTLRQAIVRPVSTAPAASRSVAVSCWVAPGAIIAVGGVRVTEATGFGDGGG